MSNGVDDFFATARDRHAIYLRKQSGQSWPWTEDKVFQDFRFCNVFRELDRVTAWVRENIREPYAGHPDLWLMLAIARQLNWPPTLAALMSWPRAFPSGAGFSPAALTAALDHRSAAGEKVYTGAYMIAAPSGPANPYKIWTKQRYIAEVVVGRLWEDRATWRALLDRPSDSIDQPLTQQRVWERFQDGRYLGWGPFMAYEVVTDMRHTRYLRGAPDIMTWANAGPGAIRGLNRIYGRPLGASVPVDQRLGEMRALLAVSQHPENWPQVRSKTDLWVALASQGYVQWEGRGALPALAESGAWPTWEMRDVEHWLCEYDKICRVRNGEGRPRSRYMQGRGY